MFALGGEEICPGNHFWMLLEQSATLAFGHPAPDTELHAVVEGIGTTFQDHRAVPADDGGFALRGTSDEQFVWIGLAAPSLGYPGDSGFGLGALDDGVG